MKFTSEDLMKAMGLQVGDRIKIDNKIFEIYISPQNELRCVNIHNSNNHFYFKNLIDKDIEILPKPKYVGDLICNETDCKNCPMKCLECLEYIDTPETIYERLKRWYEYYKDQEIYDLLKARLDKEVKE